MAAADQQPTPQTLILGTIATFLTSITGVSYYGPSPPKSSSLESVDTFCKIVLAKLAFKVVVEHIHHGPRKPNPPTRRHRQ